MTAHPAAVLDARWRAVCDADPQADLLHSGTLVLSRGEFEALVAVEAQRLREAGLASGDIVAWLGINTPQMLALLLACARVGTVFLPLNWRLAADELAAICRHAGVALLKGSADQRALAAELRASGAVPARVSARPPSGLQADDVMLVYTSGTTGRPKGAIHTQQGMLANAEMAIAVQGLDPATRALAVLPMFHVGGLCIQVLPTLLAGGQVMLHARFDPGAWLHDVGAWRPSTSLLVPATLQALLAHPDWAAAELHSLRFVNSGSSVVPVPLIEAFHARGVPVAQVYGSTETGPFSIALKPHQALAQVGRVGQPAPGVSLRLADRSHQPVAPGMVGEIQLRGPNLMRAYHREPHEIAFTPDGWFATGDLGLTHPDGMTEVVGRLKDMVISGGENIFPAEIENLLVAAPGLAECAVVGLPDERWGEVPVLAVVAQPGAELDLALLRAHYESRLARFKHPRQVLQLPALPRTALGKVQKPALVALLQAELQALLSQDKPNPG
ncbi:acyl-CoA synthetase (AMP-forming)/AMP-acid ligase II [Burkholderiales bacterium JOSHI_001]|nr:acyl-CoA synthetase (AMP-forming)/AMP-acid ligase II [Burkholderiales bacterium JOSHI_001]